MKKKRGKGRKKYKTKSGGYANWPFFAVSEKIKQTEYQKKEMGMILIKSKSMEEYAQVFCLKQIRAHYDRYENKSYMC